MKRPLAIPVAVLILFSGTLAGAEKSSLTASSPDVRYGTGKWDEEAYGNHRAVIKVAQRADAVWVHIPWRRRDASPEKKNVIFIDAASGTRVQNVFPVEVNRECGDFILQPSTVPGDYYAYFLPYVSSGRSNYPTVNYQPPSFIPDSSWLEQNRLVPQKLSPRDRNSFPQAELFEIQASDEFNSFYPMEVIATAAEKMDLLVRYPGAPYLLFPEDRRYPVRMADDLPYRWIKSGPGNEFAGEARRGEFYAFQVGVFACRAAIEDIDVTFSGLRLTIPLPSEPSSSSFFPCSPRLFSRFNPFLPSSSGSAKSAATDISTPSLSAPFASTIPAHAKSGFSLPTNSQDKKDLIPSSAMFSFNTRGVSWDGKDFKKICAVPEGKIQALWCGVQVPKDARPGRYEGELTVQPKGFLPQKIKLVLTLQDEVVADAGDSEPWRHSRLRWLDSRIAVDDDPVTPFSPLEVRGATVSCLGQSLTIGRTGLPESITSFFSPEVAAVQVRGRRLLASPIEFVVEEKDGRVLRWDGGGMKFTRRASGAVAWEANSESRLFRLACRGRMEFDGFVEVKVTLTAKAEAEVKDIRLEVPFIKDVARYMMGLGFRGGFRPAQFDWTWDQKKNQDAIWVGDVNAGLQVNLRDENYVRPLNTNFYLSQPLNLPPSWWNEGKGGLTVRETDTDTVRLTAYSGQRLIKAEESLHFHFNLLLTPFKPTDSKSHFSTRFFHAFKPVNEIAEAGANTVNVHHANAINPFINYPFLRPAEMRKYVDEAHSRGMQVKIYNTIRELSNRAPEIFALRSLGHEVFSSGPGGGFSWLQEHLGSDYIPAWFVPELKDAAIINSGMSRWHNYYLEGLAWLVKNIGIDGLYIDDLAFDRTTMKRVRKILDRGRPRALIDLHSANQFNPRDGFASSANLYLEHFPYLNRLWFGEYFDYDSPPDYWLIEISGIPFGLMGEMLQDGGNAWRGMVYGMTNRLPWSGQNPARLWKVWDEFGISDARMLGYWSPNCPVKTSSDDVLATAYVKKGKTMIALASWAIEPLPCRLIIDWKALGMDPDKAEIFAPAIADFQPPATFRPEDSILVAPGKGWLLILKDSP